MTLKRITGLFLILLPIVFNGAFAALGSTFEYPDILRQPAGDILTKFAAGGAELIGLWYLFALTSLLMIPLALLVQQIFAERQPGLAQAAGIIGVLSGLAQVMGLLRWTFVVPLLAAQYTAPAATAATQEATAVVFSALHQYAGVAIGEHLGYFFTASWTILVSLMWWSSAGRMARWLSGLGLLAAVGILAGLLEPAGWEPAGAINAIAYIGWSLWLMALGVLLLVRQPASR